MAGTLHFMPLGKIYGMDYQLGTDKPPSGYWQSVERGEIPRVTLRDDVQPFKVFMERLLVEGGGGRRRFLDRSVFGFDPLLPSPAV